MCILLLDYIMKSLLGVDFKAGPCSVYWPIILYYNAKMCCYNIIMIIKCNWYIIIQANCKRTRRKTFFFFYYINFTKYINSVLPVEKDI